MSRGLKGITILLVVYLIGEAISHIIGNLVPGNVIGMIIFFVLLQTKTINEDDVKDCCNFIINNMLILFVPICVGIMTSYRLIEDDLIGIISILTISTIVVILIVGYIQQYLGNKWMK